MTYVANASELHMGAPVEYEVTMRRRATMAPTLAAVLVTAACGEDESPSVDTTVNWSCSDERDGWERCEEGNVIWCHAFGTPHFHTGARCASAGLECVSVTDARAVCTVPEETCEAGEFSCRDNIATNCLEGRVALWPCGTRRQCVTEPGTALARISGLQNGAAVSRPLVRRP